MSPTSNPDGGPTLEPVPDSGSVPDAEEAGTDPLEPVPSDGRDAQPVVGSSDDGAAMAMDDPLREAVYVKEEDLPFVDEEAEELEDEGGLLDPEADRLVSRSIEEADEELGRSASETDADEALP